MGMSKQKCSHLSVKASPTSCMRYVTIRISGQKMRTRDPLIVEKNKYLPQMGINFSKELDLHSLNEKVSLNELDEAKKKLIK